MITINALAAADSVIIPVQAHYLPAKGMTQLIKNITRVKKRINPALKVDGVAAHAGGWAHKPCQTDGGYTAAELRERVENLSFRDPVAIKAAEISAAGKSIYAYDKGSKVAQAYADFQRRCWRMAKSNGLNFNLPSVDDLFPRRKNGPRHGLKSRQPFALGNQRLPESPV